MTKIEVNLASEYGIMFLYDSKVKPIFPPEAGTEPITRTSSCLAFSVLVYVDGDAKITLTSSSEEASGKEYFTGRIECPSKSLSLFDHNGFGFASIPLQDVFAQVSLRMSEERNPDAVECVIENAETF